MHSNELAEFVGVTVRTLRHYHQIGLMPEPSRSAGGYRQYHVGHVVRLLRIKRMTALGVPLSALPVALEHPAAADELLAGLDRQAAAEMEQLASRRATIAELRSIEAPPDLPPELSTWRTAAVDGLSAEMARYEHEVLVLFAHLLGRDGTPHFAAIVGPGDEHVAAVAPLMARFYALEADTPADQIASLIDQIVTLLAPQAAGLIDSALLSAPGEALMNELSALALTPVQYRALREIERRLVRTASAGGA